MDRAIEIAKTQSLNPGTDEAWALIEQAADLAGDLAHPLATRFPIWDDQKQTALSPTDVRDHLALLKATPGHLLIHEIESNDPMPVDRAGFEAGVGAYLKGSVKSPEIDRFILTALIQIEVSAYLNEITRTDPWFQKISELQKVRSAKHPFVYWLLGRAFDLLLAIVVIAIGFAAYRYLGMPVIALIGISLLWQYSTSEVPSSPYFGCQLYQNKWQKRRRSTSTSSRP